MQVVNLVEFMLRNSLASINYNGFKGRDWLIGNGARQGGILSPILFSFYINQAVETILGQTVGCRLGGMSYNIICYADDIAVMAPSKIGLQTLLDSLAGLLSGICLRINVSKSCNIIFKRSRAVYRPSPVKLLGQDLKIVSEYKYLGVVISDTLCIKCDVNRVTDSFLKQFNSMFCKFSYADKSILAFLFRTYTSSFYAIENWTFGASNRALQRISVAYHKAVKRVCGLNPWVSNHDACKTLGVNIFKHLYAKRRVGFAVAVINSESPCLVPLLYYLRYKSAFSHQIVEYLEWVIRFLIYLITNCVQLELESTLLSGMNHHLVCYSTLLILVICVRYLR